MDEIKIPSVMISHKLGYELKGKINHQKIYVTIDLENLFSKSDDNVFSFTFKIK